MLVRIIIAILVICTKSRMSSGKWSKATIRLVLYAIDLDRRLNKSLGVAENRACITCVTKDDKLDPQYAITHIGDFYDRTWSIITQQQAIAHIEDRA